MSWNISRTINNILFDVVDLQNKTQNITEAEPDETKFVGDIKINDSSVVTETTLTPLIQPLTEKTLYILLPLSLNGTIFNQNVYADKFIVNNDTSPPKKLYSNGDLTTQGDLLFLDTEPVNQDVNRTYFDKSLNYYAATDANFPTYWLSYL